jgi:hypothetical protein
MTVLQWFWGFTMVMGLTALHTPVSVHILPFDTSYRSIRSLIKNESIKLELNLPSMIVLQSSHENHNCTLLDTTLGNSTMTVHSTQLGHEFICYIRQFIRTLILSGVSLPNANQCSILSVRCIHKMIKSRYVCVQVFLQICGVHQRHAS